MLGNIWRRAFPSIQTPGPGSPDKKRCFQQDFPCWPSTGRCGRASPAHPATIAPSQKRLAGDSCQGMRDHSTHQMYSAGPSLVFMSSKGQTSWGKTLSKSVNFQSFTSALGYGTTSWDELETSGKGAGCPSWQERQGAGVTASWETSSKLKAFAPQAADWACVPTPI